MKAGKLSEAALQRSVLKQLHKKRDDVTAAAGIGADYAALRLEEGEEIVCSIQPVTIGRQDIGTIGVFSALNNIACSGGEPMGILVSLLVPTLMNEPLLRELMGELQSVCEAAGVQLLGGHTEVSRLVKEPLITVTAVGKVPASRRVSSQGIEPGMDIIATKWVGLEGTAILVRERNRELRTRYSQPFLDQAGCFIDEISILSEAAVAGKSGAAVMHDVSQGGIFAALWEMAQGSGVGLEIDLKKIPIRQETVEICEFFDINPYKLLSGGCLLIAGWNGNTIVREIERTGGHAVIIGKATDGNDRVIRNEEECRFLERPQTDELYRVLEW